MRPPVPLLLGNAAAMLEDQAEAQKDPVMMEDLRVLARILVAIANMYDQCAASRVDEIGMLSRLLQEGEELAGRPQRRTEGEVSTLSNMDLRIHALDAHLDSLRGRLIEMHTWLESRQGRAAAKLLTEVNDHLYETARQHALLSQVLIGRSTEAD